MEIKEIEAQIKKQGLYRSYQNAATETRIAIAKWLCSQESKQIEKIFSKPTEAWNVLSLKEPKAQVKLIEALGKLGEKYWLSVFKGGRFIELFGLLSSRDEHSATAMLDLLEKISDKDREPLFFGQVDAHASSQKRENLMQKTARFSPAIMVRALYLMMRLPSDKRREVLLSDLSKFGSSRLVIELPFMGTSPLSTEEKTKLAMVFMDVLKQKKDTAELLRKGVDGLVKPYMASLIKLGWKEAIVHYLEQSALSIPQSLLKDPALQKLDLAQSLLHFVIKKQAPCHSLVHSAETFKAALQAHPDLLSFAFSGKNGWVHLAVQHKHIEALRALLSFRVEVNVQNLQGLSPLEEVIRRKDWEALAELAFYEETDFLSPKQQERFVLSYLLNLRELDYFILKNILENIDTERAARYWPALMEGLMHLPNSALITQGLEKILKKTELEGTLFEHCKAYCDQNKDISAFFVMYLAKFLSTEPGVSSSGPPAHAASPLGDLQAFLLKQLNALDRLQNTTEFDAARRLLFFFLFGLAPQQALQLLDSLSLSPKEQMLLEDLLCFGLVQPLVFSRLSLEEHRAFHTYFRSDAPKTKALLAEQYFQTNALEHLPSTLLKELSDRHTCELLLEQQARSSNPVLLVLCLEKALREVKPPAQKIAVLFSQLEQTLSTFNQLKPPFSLIVLRAMLDLSTHPEIKEKIALMFCQPISNVSWMARLRASFSLPSAEKNHFCEKIEDLFRSQSKQNKGPMIAQGFLGDCYQALMGSVSSNVKDHETALNHHFKALPLDQCKQFLTEQTAAFKEAMVQESKQAQQGLSALLTTFNHLALPEEKHHWDLNGPSTAPDPSFRQGAEQLFLGLNKAFLQREDKNLLWKEWMAWFRQIAALVPQGLLLKQFVPVIKTCSLENLESYFAEETKILEWETMASPLLQALERASSWEEWLGAFLAAEEESFMALISLAQKSASLDLERALQALFALKKDPERADLLLEQGPEQDWKALQAWFLQKKEAIHCRTSSALSMQALKVFVRQKETDQASQLRSFADWLSSNERPLLPETWLLFIEEHRHLLEEDSFSAPSQDFVHILHKGFMQLSEEALDELLLALPSGFLEPLLEHCLSGTGSANPERRDACKALSLRLCKSNNPKRDLQLEAIQDYLSPENLQFLGDKRALAKEILASTQKTSTAQGLVFKGLWLQALLLSPAFVAELDADLMQQVVERYCALCRALKKHQRAALIRLLNDKENLASMQANPMFSPNVKAHLEAKKDGVESFTLNDCLRGIFNQFEQELARAPQQIRDKARKVYDAYLLQQLRGMKHSFAFRMADYLYSQLTDGKESWQKAPNCLMQWFEEKCPHYSNFTQKELASHLADEKGNNENLFQEQSAAWVLKTMPEAELKRSKAGLKLLFKDIFRKPGALKVLFDETPEEKTRWLREELAERFKRIKGPLQARSVQDPAFFPDFVRFQDIEHLLALLANTKNVHNAKLLFEAILKDKAKRKELFEAAGGNALADFFKKTDAAALLADYLLHYRDSEDFVDGLDMFIKLPEENLLHRALNHLTLAIEDKNQALPEAEFDSVMTKLISDETVANALLTGFLKDAPGSQVAETHGESHQLLCQHFSKHHIMSTLEALNGNKVAHRSARHRLMLSIFYAGQEALLQSREVRLSKFAWGAKDLRALSAFTLNLYHKNPNCVVTQLLMTEALFRSANYGDPFSLFYIKKGQLYKKMLETCLQRSTLDTFAARFYTLQIIKQAGEGVVALCKRGIFQLHNWLSGNHTAQTEREAMLQELENHNMVMDWKKMAKASWQGTKGRKLPMITAFLCNYSGKSKDLLQFLGDIFKDEGLLKNKALMHNISGIMASHPERDVSKVIFKAFDELLSHEKFVQLLDEDLFRNMANFYSYHQEEQAAKAKSAEIPKARPAQVPSAEAYLLDYFGQKKRYALTCQSAYALMRPSNKTKHNAWLKKLAIEAYVELELRPERESMFFGLWKFCVRAFYGTWGSRTHFVKRCEDKSPGPQPIPLPERVTTPLGLGGQIIEAIKETQQKRARLKAQQSVLRSSGPLNFYAERQGESKEEDALELSRSQLLSQ